MPSSSKVFQDFLSMARLTIPISKFLPKTSPLPGVKKLLYDERGLSIEMTSYDKAKTMSIDIARAPSRAVVRSGQMAHEKAVSESIKDFARKHSVFSGNFPAVESVQRQGNRLILVREEKPFGFDSSTRANRICYIENSDTGFVQSITVQFDRQYVAPKVVPTLASMRKRFPALSRPSNLAHDLILWVPEDYLRPDGSITKLILCYDIVTSPMNGGEHTTVHTYYDLTSGKKIGQIDPRTFRQGGR